MIDAFMTENELDFFELLNILKRGWKTLLVACVIVSLVTYVVSGFLPKYYKSHCSFFVNSMESPNSFLSANPALQKLAASGDIFSRISEVIKSHSVKLSVAEALLPEFEDELKQAEMNKELGTSAEDKILFVLGKLNFKDRFSFRLNRSQLYILSYASNDPKFAYKVLNTLIEKIQDKNQTLELSPNRKILTIIDPPRVPRSYFYPRKSFNAAVSFLLCFFVVGSILIAKDTVFRRG